MGLSPQTLAMANKYTDDKNKKIDAQLADIPKQSYITDKAKQIDLNATNVKVNNLEVNKATKSEVDVERKRIDGFTRLTSGSTTGDAELIDGRIGTDGITYDNIGSAIRGQVSALKTHVISTINGGSLSQTINYTSGGYVNNTQQNITPQVQFSYSELIQLRKGETITVSAKSNTATVVDMVSRWSSDGTKYISSIYAFKNTNTLETASYTATNKIEYIRVCYTTSLGLPVVRISINGIREINGNLNDIYNYSIKKEVLMSNINKIAGKYCNAITKQLTSLANYFYTDLYILNKGDVITVTSKDPSGNAVARISKWNSDGTVMTSVISVGTVEVSTVTYTAVEKIEYIRFSGYTANKFDIYKEVTSIPSEFKNAVDGIISDYILTDVPTITYPSLSMFETIGVCGDSYVKGQIYNSNGVVGDKPNLAWGSNLARLNGVEV